MNHINKQTALRHELHKMIYRSISEICLILFYWILTSVNVIVSQTTIIITSPTDSSSIASGSQTTVTWSSPYPLGTLYITTLICSEGSVSSRTALNTESISVPSNFYGSCIIEVTPDSGSPAIVNVMVTQTLTYILPVASSTIQITNTKYPASLVLNGII